MAVNARTEEFQHIEVFDKPALFTNGRIARDTVPKGWYCYDIRGSDDDPGELCYMEENVVVNHAGSVLMPEKLAIPKSGRLDVRDELGFLDEGDMTLREFCEAHQLPYPAENMKFHIRPARPEEAGLFYAQHPEEDKRLGAVGCVRMDFGRSGNEFWHTWWPRGSEKLNSPAFKLELQEVVDTLRESVLKNRFAITIVNERLADDFQIVMPCNVVLANGSLACDGVAFNFVPVFTGQAAVNRRPVNFSGHKNNLRFLFGVIHQIRKTKASASCMKKTR